MITYTELKSASREIFTDVVRKYMNNISANERVLIYELAAAPTHTLGNPIVISKWTSELAEHATLSTMLLDISHLLVLDLAARKNVGLNDMLATLRMYLNTTDTAVPDWSFGSLAVSILGKEAVIITKARIL
jgi:hypothetical protein